MIKHEERKMKKYAQREQILLNALQVNLKITTYEAAQMLGISESSARRLFSDLEKDEKVTRIYGGIQSANKSINEVKYSYDDLRDIKSHEKINIAKKACSFIQDNDIIYLDCGTTLFQLSLAVAKAILNGELNNIKITTNSLANLEVLYPYCDVILVGGTYNSDRKDFSGYSSEIYIRQFNYKKAFLGADGLTIDQGLMAMDESIARLDKLVITRSEESYILLDSSKFGKKSFLGYCDASEITTVITDNKLSDGSYELFSNDGISIVRADK